MEFFEPENRKIVRSQLIQLGYLNCNEILDSVKALIPQDGGPITRAVMTSVDKSVFAVESEFSLIMLDNEWTLQQVAARMNSYLPFLEDALVVVRKNLIDGDFGLKTKQEIMSNLRTSLTSRILVAMPGLELGLLSLGFEEDLRKLQFCSYSDNNAKFELWMNLPPDTGNIRFINMVLEAQLVQEGRINSIEVTRYTYDEPQDAARFENMYRLPNRGEIIDAYNLSLLKDLIIHQDKSWKIVGNHPNVESKVDIRTPPKFKL